MANIKEAFEYAAQNPNSDFANNLKQLVISGSLDQEAKKYGIDLTPLKPKEESKPKEDSFLQRLIKNVAVGTVKPVENIANTLTDVIGAGASEIGSRIAGTDTQTFGERLKQEAEGRKGTGVVSAIDPTQTAQTRDITTTEGIKGLAGDVGQVGLLLAPQAKVAKGIMGVTGSKALGAIGTGALTGYGYDVASGLSEGEKLGEAVKPGMGTVLGTAIPLAPYVIQATGRVSKKVGEKVVEAVMPKSTQEAQILQAYKSQNTLPQRITQILKGESKTPQGAYKTTVEKGLMGTKSMIGIQADRASKKLWNDLIAPELKSSGVKIDLPKYFDTVEQTIISSTDDVTRQNSLIDALNAIREDYKGLNNVDLPKLQKLKEGWAEFVPEKFYKGQNIAGNVRQVQALLADEARNTIYNTLGNNVKQAYFDYGNLKGLKELGITSMTAQKLKGGQGAQIAEILSQSVTPIGTIAGRGIYKLGSGLELIGKAGVSTIEDVLGLTNKTGQVLSQPIKTQTSQTIANQNKNVSKISNISNNIPQKTSKVNKIVDKSIPKELQPLAEEARKYKSAEEFVKAQGKPVYHGTDVANIIEKEGFKKMPIKTGVSAFGEGSYFTNKIGDAKGYGDVVKAFLQKDIKLKKVFDSDAYKIDTQKLIKDGYGGTILETGNGNNIVIFDTAKIKTKQQLIDIWNKANKN